MSLTRCIIEFAWFTARALAGARQARIALLVGVTACGSSEPSEVAADELLLPADFPTGFEMVNSCEAMGEHGVRTVNIYVNDLAVESFRAGASPLPDGSVIVKEEFADSACTERQGWALMRREASGVDTEPSVADWRWQRLDARRGATGDDLQCKACHTACASDDYVCVERGR